MRTLLKWYISHTNTALTHYNKPYIPPTALRYNERTFPGKPLQSDRNNFRIMTIHLAYTDRKWAAALLCCINYIRYIAEICYWHFVCVCVSVGVACHTFVKVSEPKSETGFIFLRVLYVCFWRARIVCVF